MTPHGEQPDPRSKRALILGAALLALIAAWNIDWWDGDEYEGMRIETGQDEDIGRVIEREIAGEVRESIEEARREASRSGGEEGERAPDNAAGDANAMVADQGDPTAIEVESDARGGLRINVVPERNDEQSR